MDHPVSLYAATKRADELMSETYAHLFRIPMTGLRFFTVYGPWGRPDMALFLFTRAILEGKPIDVFNHGDMSRDFTYVADIVVEDNVIVELKAVSSLHPTHTAQCINILKATGLPLCLLMNFGGKRLEVRRLYRPR